MADTDNPNPPPPQESDSPDSSSTRAQIWVLREMLSECTGVPTGGAAGQSRSEGTREQSKQSPLISDNAGELRRMPEGVLEKATPGGRCSIWYPLIIPTHAVRVDNLLEGRKKEEK